MVASKMAAAALCVLLAVSASSFVEAADKTVINANFVFNSDNSGDVRVSTFKGPAAVHWGIAKGRDVNIPSVESALKTGSYPFVAEGTLLVPEEASIRDQYTSFVPAGILELGVEYTLVIAADLLLKEDVHMPLEEKVFVPGQDGKPSETMPDGKPVTTLERAAEPAHVVMGTLSVPIVVPDPTAPEIVKFEISDVTDKSFKMGMQLSMPGLVNFVVVNASSPHISSADVRRAARGAATFPGQALSGAFPLKETSTIMEVVCEGLDQQDLLEALGTPQCMMPGEAYRVYATTEGEDGRAMLGMETREVTLEDNSPPCWAEEPEAMDVEEDGFFLGARLSEPGTMYYSVFPRGSPSLPAPSRGPTWAEIAAGASIGAAAPLAAGSILQSSFAAPVGQELYGLDPHQVREMDVYMVAEDDQQTPNQLRAIKVFPVSLPDTTPPRFLSGYPKIVPMGAGEFAIDVELDEPGEVYYEIREELDADPADGGIVIPAPRANPAPKDVVLCAQEGSACPRDVIAAGSFPVGEAAPGKPYDGPPVHASAVLGQNDLVRAAQEVEGFLRRAAEERKARAQRAGGGAATATATTKDVAVVEDITEEEEPEAEEAAGGEGEGVDEGGDGGEGSDGDGEGEAAAEEEGGEGGARRRHLLRLPEGRRFRVLLAAADDEGNGKGRTGNLGAVTAMAVGSSDTTAPTLTLLGASTVTINSYAGGDFDGYYKYVDAGATAADAVDGDITSSIEIDNPVDTSRPQTYTVTYNVKDAAGNAAAPVTRTVIVSADGWKPQVSGKYNDLNSAPSHRPFTGDCCRYYKTCALEDFMYQCTAADVEACAMLPAADRDAKCNLCMTCDTFTGLAMNKIVDAKPTNFTREACIAPGVRTPESTWPKFAWTSRKMLYAKDTGVVAHQQYKQYDLKEKVALKTTAVAKHVQATPKFSICKNLRYICIQHQDHVTNTCPPSSDLEGSLNLDRDRISRTRNDHLAEELLHDAHTAAESKFCIFCKK